MGPCGRQGRLSAASGPGGQRLEQPPAWRGQVGDSEKGSGQREPQSEPLPTPEPGADGEAGHASDTCTSQPAALRPSPRMARFPSKLFQVHSGRRLASRRRVERGARGLSGTLAISMLLSSQITATPLHPDKGPHL